MSTKIRKKINSTRHEIGICLYALRQIKQAPDNTTLQTRLSYQERLGRALSSLRLYRQTYPTLFDPKVEQLALEL